MEGTSHAPFAFVETFLSLSYPIVVGNIPRLNIGEKTSKIDIETTIYFDNRQLILDIRRGKL